MSKYECEVCKERVYKDNSKCIVHCNKTDFKEEDLNYFETSLSSLLSTSSGSIEYIHFPKQYKLEEKNFININEFTNCHFYNTIKLLSFEGNYSNCTFYKNIIINDKINKFVKCNFKSAITIIKISEDKIFINLFEECNFNKNKHFLFKNIEFTSENKIEILFSNLTIINKIYFSNCEFKNDLKLNKLFHLKRLHFNACRFSSRLEVLNCKNIDEFSLRNSVFKTLSLSDDVAKVKIQFCEIYNANFYNTSFDELADFYQTKFLNSVNFERTDFNKISVFSECEFDCNVDFKYAKFLGKSIFRDTVIKGKLNLRDTIFNDEANFLDITSHSRWNVKKQKFIGEPLDIKVENRETARVIKDCFDKQNNIIEANRFYKLEMQKRTKELFILHENDNSLFEKFVFIFHRLSSNHSQSWALSLFWIIIISLGYTYYFTGNEISDNYLLVKEFQFTEVFFDSNFSEHKVFYQLFLFILAWLIFLLLLFDFHISGFLFSITLVSIGIYIFTTGEYKLLDVVDNINPFSIMTGKVKLTLSLLLYKTFIGYLLYQLIISIRQNTRRK
ncbi:MAG: hypothetical protein COA66_12780 [Arcobacter sp.]|nr:MAG: hypothetical protein COA66_12780 [Arcobacter sp.]